MKQPKSDDKKNQILITDTDTKFLILTWILFASGMFVLLLCQYVLPLTVAGVLVGWSAKWLVGESYIPQGALIGAVLGLIWLVVAEKKPRKKPETEGQIWDEIEEAIVNDYLNN